RHPAQTVQPGARGPEYLSCSFPCPAALGRRGAGAARQGDGGSRQTGAGGGEDQGGADMSEKAILERALFAIKPGKTEEFAGAFAKARKLLEASPGFQRLEMRRGLEAPETFLLLVWWDSV